MKKLSVILVFIGVIVLWSCSSVRYNRVYSYEDEYRGSSREYVRFMLKPEERRTEIGHAEAIFERVRSKDVVYDDVYFVIMRTSSSFGADRQGFMKAGGKNYEIELLDPVTEFRTKSEETVSTVISKDTSGVSVSTTTDIDTRSWIEEKFMVRIPGSYSGISGHSDELIFRFYFGPVPATYVITGKKLDLIKGIMDGQDY